MNFTIFIAKCEMNLVPSNQNSNPGAGYYPPDRRPRSSLSQKHMCKMYFSSNAAADKITSLPGLDKLPDFDMYSGYLNITGAVQLQYSSKRFYFRFLIFFRKRLIFSLNKRN